MFGTPDSAAALARTITDATSRAEPVVTRIDFAPGHEDARLSSEQIAALMRKVRLAPRMLAALSDLLREAVVLSDDYLETFRDWPADATIQGWDKARWLRAAAAAKAARALIAEAEATGHATSQGARQ